MTELFTFLIKASITLIVLYLSYRWLFSGMTFFNANRFVLISFLLISVLVPFLRLPSFLNNPVPVDTKVQEWFESPQDVTPITPIHVKQTASDRGPISIEHVLLWLYLAAVSGLSVRYVLNLTRLVRYPRKFRQVGNYTNVYITPYSHPFSFFRRIYVPDGMHEGGLEGILAHEKVHVKCGHSFDRILIDLFVILFWFNPFIYFYRKSLIEVHEYEADKCAIAELDKSDYLSLLLAQISARPQMPSVSFFDYSLTKKRITMMNKRNSDLITMLRYLVIIPVVGAISVMFSNGQEIVQPVVVAEPVVPAVKPMVPGLALPAGLNLPPDPIVVSFPFQSSKIPSIFPVDAREVEVKISSRFGKRADPFTGADQMHTGIDIKAPTGTPVIATADGTVTKANYQPNGYGYNLVLEHADGYSTRYAQMESYIVQKGDKVEQGEVIGYVGSSGRSVGPHLHYAISRHEKYVDPEDYIRDYLFKQESEK